MVLWCFLMVIGAGLTSGSWADALDGWSSGLGVLFGVGVAMVAIAVLGFAGVLT